MSVDKPEWKNLLPSEKIELARAASASTYDEIAKYMGLGAEVVRRKCAEERELTPEEDERLRQVIVAKHKALAALGAGEAYQPLGIAPMPVVLEAFDSLAPHTNSQFGLQFKGHYLAVKLAFYMHEMLSYRGAVSKVVLINILSTYGLPEYVGTVVAENTKTQTEAVFTIKLTQENKGSIKLRVTRKNGMQNTAEEVTFTENRIRNLATKAVLGLMDKPIKEK